MKAGSGSLLAANWAMTTARARVPTETASMPSPPTPPATSGR